MEFEEIANGLVNDHFENLTKAVKFMSDTARNEYASNFGVRIWTVAGPNEANSFAISVN